MCKAQYASGYFKQTFTCEVEGEHLTATDDYGTHEIHFANICTGTRIIKRGGPFSRDQVEKVMETFTWDDIMPAAVPAP